MPTPSCGCCVTTCAASPSAAREEALARIGVVAVVPSTDLALLPDAVGSAGTQDLVVDPEPVPSMSEPTTAHGRLVAVHGPGGAPGRTTLAIGLATEHARRGEPSVLVDADPYGGVVAQHLGVLDEVSGLLAAARLVNSGGLDAASFARCRRRVADRCEVLTGLPRPDRWVEVRAGVLDAVLDRAADVGDVVVDTGFSLEDVDPSGGRRCGPVAQSAHPDAVTVADLVVVVGSADPVGLARLARTLVELRDVTPPRSSSSSTGCATPWAGAAATSSGWSRATCAPPGCTSCPRTAPSPTVRWWRAVHPSSWVTPRWRVPSGGPRRRLRRKRGA